MTACPILVVDDDPSIRAIVADILSDEGYSVATATNGAEALALVERTAPALLLLDMRMPVLDEWGVARGRLLAARPGARRRGSLGVTVVPLCTTCRPLQDASAGEHHG